MANTVSVLNYTNTFGDLLTQQNIAAKELNNLGANNYTKDSGTLYLNGLGTGLSVTNTAAFGAAIVSTTLAVSGDSTLLANVYLNASGYPLQVSNNAIIHKSLITDNVVSNVIVRTTTVNALGSVFANNITSNNNVLTTTLNVQDKAYVDNLKSNNAITASIINGTTRGYFADLTSNNQINSVYLNLSGNVTSDLNVTTDVNGRDFAGRVGRFDNIQAGSMTISGNFVVSSPTIYSSNAFTLNAGNGAGATSYLSVDRGISGANAAIRWNESFNYWEVLDVNNGQYYRVLSNEYLSNATNLNSASNVATSAALYTLQTQLQANSGTFSSNISTLTSNVAAINTYSQTSFARANTSANVFIGTSGVVVPNNGVVSFNSNNGVVISATANTLYINTPQDLTTTANPTFNSIYNLGNPLSVSNGGTGSSNGYLGLINLLPSTVGIPNGYVLSANANSINWVTSGPYFANNITFTAPYAGISNVQSTIQLAIQDLETRKATITSPTISNPTFTGVPVAPTAANSTSTTQIATTAFVNNLVLNALSANTNTTTYGSVVKYATNVPGLLLDQTVSIGSNVRFFSVGVGTNPANTLGDLRSVGNITAYYSDDKLKTRLGSIENALDKVMSLTGFYHEANELAQSLGYEAIREVGVSAQEVNKVMPEVVAPAPIDPQYMTVRYERLVPLLIEAIKELKAEIDSLKAK
jgi:hypothetical protein